MNNRRFEAGARNPSNPETILRNINISYLSRKKEIFILVLSQCSLKSGTSEIMAESKLYFRGEVFKN